MICTKVGKLITSSKQTDKQVLHMVIFQKQNYKTPHITLGVIGVMGVRPHPDVPVEVCSESSL